MQFVGIGTYDENDRELVSLKWVAEGTYQGYPPWDKPDLHQTLSD